MNKKFSFGVKVSRIGANSDRRIYVLGARFFSRLLRFWKKSAGFTLSELVVVIALMVIIALVAFLNLSNYRRVQNLKLTMEEIVTVIRDTQRRAITQENGLPWFVSFKNEGSEKHKYEVFSGDPYGELQLDKSYILKRGEKFSEPASAGGYYDAVFAAVTGKLPENKIISLITGAKDGFVGDIILNTLGLVVSRLENNLIGYWHLDEESRSSFAPDATGGGNIGKLYSGNSECIPYQIAFCPVWEISPNCKVGNCASFSRDDSNYISGDINAELSAFTIESWVKLTGNQNKGAIFTGYSGSTQKISARFLATSKKPSFYTSPPGTSLDYSIDLETNQWYHLAFVYNGTFRKIYLNGAEIKSDSLSNQNFTIDNFDIGRSEKNNSFTLDGYLDEVRVYNRALSPQEISNHYNDFKL